MYRNNKYLCSLLTSVLIAFLGVGKPLQAQGQKPATTLERSMLEIAPSLIDGLRKIECNNVGVMKFEVWKDGEVSYSVGAINANLAKRLELSLYLSNTVSIGDQKKGIQPLNLIRNASAAIASIGDIDTRKEGGRKSLFGRQYDLAWGNSKISPDGFLTGLAIIDPSRTSIHYVVLLFTKDNPKYRVFQPSSKSFQEFRLDKMPPGALQTVAMRSNLLTEIGDNFRSLKFGKFQQFDPTTGKKTDQAPVQLPNSQNGQSTTPPPSPKANDLELPEPPVTLEILQSKTKFPGGNLEAFLNQTEFDTLNLAFEGGKAFIKGLKEDHPMRIRLKRDTSESRYGVVLRVNGINTLGMGRGADAQARLWVMDANTPTLTLSGYQIEGNQANPFLITPDVKAAALSKELNLGDDTGTITLTVFKEKDANTPKTVPDNLALQRKEKAIENGELPNPKEAQSATNPGALVSTILKERNRAPGLITANKESTLVAPIRIVTFERDATPILHATIRYFQPIKGQQE